MKKILHFSFFCLLLMSSSLFAQTTVDFEVGGEGADWTWIMDQNGDNPPLEFIANPVSGGNNTTAQVAKFTARSIASGAQPWALTFTDDIEVFQFDATNSTVTIQVYKTEISNVGLKFEGSSPAVEILIPNTTVDQWETITYDFSGSIGNSYNRLVIIPDFQTRAQENIVYFDNIVIPEGNIAPPATPTVGAPIPVHNETTDNVISIYSDSYTDLANTNFNPNWGQLTIQSFVSIAGNEANKYSNLNYQGTEFAAAQDISASGYIHIDYWTPNAANIEFFLISQTTGERKVDLPITFDQWMSVDIPLHEFVSQGLGITDIFQFKVVGTGDVFFDNWYFHGDYFAPPQAMPLVGAPIPTHNETTDNVLSIYSDTYTNLAGTDFNPNWGQGTAQSFETIAGNPANKYVGLNYQGTAFAAAQDVSASGYFHVDFWTANATALEFFLISASTGEKKVDLPITAEQWVSVDIPLHEYVDQGLGITDIIQFKVVGDGNVWFDNWYFHGDYFAPPQPMPTGPAAIPTHDQTNNGVICIFSDVYTIISGVNYNPNWGQTTAVTFEDFSGNFLMKYSGLNYQGTDFAANPQDVSGLEFLHVDFWSSNSTDLGLYLVSPGAEHEYVFTITPNAWNSIDIPLVHFATGATQMGGAAPVDLLNIIQLKAEGNGNVWWDNIYFWGPASLPIELTSFDAISRGQEIAITWETSQEVNNDYFQIERSKDGRTFETLATVDGAGNSDTPQSYQIIDNKPFDGVNYYRLTQVDFNGRNENSEIVSAMHKSDSGFELIRNITIGDELSLTYNVKKAGDYTLSIVDVTGRIISQQEIRFIKGVNEVSLNLNDSGLLFIMLNNETNRVIDKIFK